MESLPATDFGRRALSYSLEGMAARDAVLFKSLVRLLDHLTVQKWIYRPPSADYRVDLLVVAEWHPPTVYRHLQPVMQPVLSIGKGAEREMCLSWPVQPQRLQAVLNKVGNVAVLHQIEYVPSVFESAQSGSSDDNQQLYRLKQWPPSRYLAGTGRMRLATLLTGRAMTVKELEMRSALPLSVCRAFVADLLKAQLLVITTVAKPNVEVGYEPHELLNLPSSTVAFVKPGLLSRIRAGLGIKSSRNG
jgi:hypothetical protein